MLEAVHLDELDCDISLIRSGYHQDAMRFHNAGKRAGDAATALRKPGTSRLPPERLESILETAEHAENEFRGLCEEHWRRVQSIRDRLHLVAVGRECSAPILLLRGTMWHLKPDFDWHAAERELEDIQSAILRRRGQVGTQTIGEPGKTSPGGEEGVTPELDDEPEVVNKDDSKPKKQRKLSPSRTKARAAYDWAMSEILGAEDMTYAELFDAIQHHPSDASKFLPDNAEAFGRYLRETGVTKYVKRSEKDGRGGISGDSI